METLSPLGRIQTFVSVCDQAVRRAARIVFTPSKFLFPGIGGVFLIFALVPNTHAQLTIQIDVAEKSRCGGVAQVDISQGEEWLYSTPIPVGASAEFRMNAGKYKLRAVTPDKCMGLSEFEYDGKQLHLTTHLSAQNLFRRAQSPQKISAAKKSGVGLAAELPRKVIPVPAAPLKVTTS
ncbi:MAG: hypothetical protein K2X47_05660, partial [Bdellovibrionales bacterium]|nr:hypothetical protein [Bdellovibrionales bacterium]